MQILSTLTLPNLTHLFSNRPSTDLRRPLQGTEPLLSALADSFTRGSVPTLLSALECLKMRKSHREVINETLLQKRCESLLYGLVVAGGRLVSVVRPRRHSLHPSDLQLVFNMLFEAEGVKAGGGENWIPLCLPGFNKNGYLYMYVSFIDPREEENAPGTDEASRQNEVAVLLISANKEGFYDLRKMRDDVVEVCRLSTCRMGLIPWVRNWNRTAVWRSSNQPFKKGATRLPTLFPARSCSTSSTNQEPTCSSPCHPTSLRIPPCLHGAGNSSAPSPLCPTS